VVGINLAAKLACCREINCDWAISPRAALRELVSIGKSLDVANRDTAVITVHRT
jgi:hypothetical protein